MIYKFNMVNKQNRWKSNGKYSWRPRGIDTYKTLVPYERGQEMCDPILFVVYIFVTQWNIGTK